MQKKLLAIVMSVTLLVMMAPGVSAMTTEELMAQIAALQAQLTALQAQLNLVSPSPSPVVGSFGTNLYFGLRGANVVALQNFLIGKGHLAAGLNTGWFGPLTKAAVMAYQTAKSITPVAGYFGPLTRAAANA
ncbi:peptidoglycan-binding protein, partial [Patescibacteria group bacterium]|nr:peptidoglycan-binding protein [Patescibacteria group bacterium]